MFNFRMGVGITLGGGHGFVMRWAPGGWLANMRHAAAILAAPVPRSAPCLARLRACMACQSSGRFTVAIMHGSAHP